MSMPRKSKCSSALAPPPLDQLGDQLGQRAEAEGELQIAVLLLGDHLEGVGAQLPLEPLEVGRRRSSCSTMSSVSSLTSSVRFDRLAARAPRPAQRAANFSLTSWIRPPKPVDDAPVKARLHHAPLAAPEIALAGHDAVAEQDLDPIHALALGVVAVVGEQHVLDVVRVVDDVVVDAAAGREHAVDVAVSARNTRAAAPAIRRCRRDRSPRRARGDPSIVASRTLYLRPRSPLRSKACAARRPSRQWRRAEETRGGGLRNTIYEQQTRSGRRLTRSRLLLYRVAVPIGVCC